MLRNSYNSSSHQEEYRGKGLNAKTYLERPSILHEGAKNLNLHSLPPSLPSLLTVDFFHLLYPDQHHPIDDQQEGETEHVVDEYYNGVTQHKLAQVVQIPGSQLMEKKACSNIK